MPVHTSTVRDVAALAVARVGRVRTTDQHQHQRSSGHVPMIFVRSVSILDRLLHQATVVVTNGTQTVLA
jgi:hypothetical protein